jgi:hypothetical protein
MNPNAACITETNRYNRSYLGWRTGHLVPLWQPCTGSSFQLCGLLVRRTENYRDFCSHGMWAELMNFYFLSSREFHEPAWQWTQTDRQTDRQCDPSSQLTCAGS